MDTYVGERSAGGPVVVLLHGFGLDGPGRPLADLGALAEEIASLGSTVFAFGWQTGSGFSADSADDLSCMGPFVAAKAAGFGADPDNVIVIGHSMGAEAGSMLAFTAFGQAPSSSCVETGRPSDPVAFVGIGGAYGMVGGPVDDDETRFRMRTYPNGTFAEFDAHEDVVPGLTAHQLYRLDGYSAMPPSRALDIVLVIGSEDQYQATDTAITAAFAEALRAEDAPVDVITIDGADHEDVVDPATESGSATMEVIAEVLLIEG